MNPRCPICGSEDHVVPINGLDSESHRYICFARSPKHPVIFSWCPNSVRGSDEVSRLLVEQHIRDCNEGQCNL